MNPTKQALYKHIRQIRIIVYVLLLIFLIILVLRPILISIENRNYWNDSILTGNPIVFKVSEVIVDDKSIIFLTPKKVILEVIEDKESESSNVYKVRINVP